MSLEKHKSLTTIRTKAYEELFGSPPMEVFPPNSLFRSPDERFIIDVLVYRLMSLAGDVKIAVTNGMSDQSLNGPEDPRHCRRRELIQYLPMCTTGHARRLHDMAWLPLFDNFFLDSPHTIEWPHPAVAGTPWKNAFFLRPLIRAHREFTCELEGERMSFLWHIPISDEELEFKREHGTDALIDRMEAVDLPWVFDERNRQSLLI